jgi:hypothetical protein
MVTVPWLPWLPWLISSQSPNHVGESSLITPSPSQTDARHHAPGKATDRRQLWRNLRHSQRSSSVERGRIATLCVYFLTFPIFFYSVYFLFCLLISFFPYFHFHCIFFRIFAFSFRVSLVSPFLLLKMDLTELRLWTCALDSICSRLWTFWVTLNTMLIW